MPRGETPTGVHPIHILTAFSVLACAACAGLMCAQWGMRRYGYEAPLALGLMAIWGVFQLALHVEPDPEIALRLGRLSGIVWVPLGPLALRIFMNSARNEDPHWLLVRRGLDACAAILIVLHVGTPWIVASVLPTSWGYAVVPGPLYLAATSLTAIGAACGVRVGRGAARHSTPREQKGQRWIAAAVGAPLLIIGITDVLLPVLGVLVPLSAPTIFGPLGLLALIVRVRLGYSPLAPGQVAGDVLEILPDGVALVGPDGHIRLCNDSLARLCATSPEELVGVHVESLLRWSAEKELGSERKAELLIEGRSPVPVAVRSAEHRDSSGEASGRVLVLRDLREVAQLRGQLVVSARLAAVGELAAGIAHEINNPLAFVRANLSHLESCWKQLRPLVERAGAPEMREALSDGDELLEESIEGVDRAVEIVRGVKSFAHVGSQTQELCDLRPLIEDTLKVASAQLRGRVEVLREYCDELPPILGSPQQLKQVFLNLVVNAAQAVGPDGTVLVATRHEDDWVIVSVADDGCGIPSENLERLFDPFFTTKPVGEGTGLGLGISHQIVHRHGGEIEVESEPGRGSVFRVRLPAAEA